MNKNKLIAEINSTNMSKFTKSCYIALLNVPKGKVVTYQGLAQMVGANAPRAVGSAMRKNPFAPEVPCHRVVRSDGSIGKYAYGSQKKKKLLAQEGVNIEDEKVSDLEKYVYSGINK